MDITATIGGQLIAFIVFVIFCMKKVWPPLTEALEERRKKIADGLEAADRGQKDLTLAQERATEQLREAKTTAAGIIDQANKRAAQIVDEAKDQAREEGQRIIVGAKAEIDQEMNRAKEQLRSQVAAIAISGAEKILETTIDASSHNELAEKLAASL